MKAYEIAALMKAVSSVVKDHFSWAIAPIVRQFEDRAKGIEERIESIPVPLKGEPGADAYELAVLSGFVGKRSEWLASLKGEPGDPGRVDVDWFAELVREEVKQRVAEIPQAKDGEPGKDADPAVVAELVSKSVAEIVASIPSPADGKDADPEVIRSMVAEAVAAIPRPENGKDADPEMVRALVAEAVAEIPPAQPGEPGKDADPAVIADLVAKSVADIVTSLPKPEKGEPGKDADPEIVRGIVQELIDKAIAAIPEPQSVEPIHEDTVARIAFEAAQKAVAAIPTPRDGLDAVEINIHPMMEEGKSYPSGVYIRHKGGLVRTTTTGYDVIINGVDTESEVTLEDGRTIERTTTYTDGTTFVRRHKFAVMMHRGTWQPKAYERGDCVTRDSSTWHCIAESTETSPPSKDWQLIVRKGDKGKDAPTPRPPQGPVKL